MIDHTAIRVSNIDESRKFYQATLGAIGHEEIGPYDGAYGYIEKDKPDDPGHLWIVEENYLTKDVHIAFRVESKKDVQEFYKAAIKAGGKDNGKPGMRPEYGENYYGAFVLDPDGNNIEAVTYI